METWEWITVAVVAGAAVVLLLALASVAVKRRRRRHLQERFGGEYERAVSTSGRREGEHLLSEVEREHEDLEIRELPSAARERYLEEWRQAELRFIGDPRDAVRSAERVLVHILEDSGYPSNGDAEHQAAHVAVDHPEVAERYRHGRARLEKDGDQETENLRRAMIDFRAVVDELVGGGARTAA
jgi:hypothetical protein